MLDTFYKFIVGAPNPYRYSSVDGSSHLTQIAPKLPLVDSDKVKNLLEASVILTRIALKEETWSKASDKSYATAVHEAAAPAIERLNQAAAEISSYHDNSLFELFSETVMSIRKELDKVDYDCFKQKREIPSYSSSLTLEGKSLRQKALDDYHTAKFRKSIGEEIWVKALKAQMNCDPEIKQLKLFPNPPNPTIKNRKE